MSLQTLLNPFTRIAGFSALLYGCFFMLLTTAIAAPCGVNFVGSLNIHVARPMPFMPIFSLLILGWLVAATCFYIAGLLFSPSKIRAVDVFGTFALARTPFLMAALSGLLPGLANFDPLQPPPVFWVFAAIALLVDIWVVILSYNAFAVSANVKSKWLFTGVFVVSEIVAVILSILLTAGLSVASAKAPTLDDAEHVEIAQKFVERLFAHPDESPFEGLQATEKMKEFFTPAAVKHWSNKIINDYGKLGDCVKVEVVRHNQDSRSVFLFFQGEQRPVKMWVTFDDKLISGFHYDTWHEAAGVPEGVRIALLAVYVSVVLPILIILVIYYGEKWRGRWLEARNRDLEAFSVEQTVGTVYCESQSPLWFYLLLFVILVPILMLTESHDLYSSLVLSCIIAVAVGFLSGGLRVEVNDESVKVKWGGLRFRILRIPLDSIASVEVNSFRPMRDFGGWGIKGGWTKNWKGVAGFFMSGTRGVLIQTKKGKKYLLGSDTPDRLAAVIRSRIV